MRFKSGRTIYGSDLYVYRPFPNSMTLETQNQGGLPPASGREVPSNDHCEQFLREFSRERDAIAAYIHSLLPHADDADDVLQRCSLLLWRKFDQFDGERSFRAWAFGVVFYEVCNFLRSTRRDRLQFSTELMERIADQRLEDAGPPRNQLALLRSCLRLLKPADQELIRAAYAKTESLSRFAEAEGVVLGSLYNRLWKLRRQLLACVRKKMTLEEGTHA
ncbi:sigma-70 family RNA polymerase sigma factor [Planctomicrobium sp. SH664]|uniref:sigma-70 family RNA polymerase sigma factor n=1 Tax=Planctomicrobium sp. SH664 TaxID=3448125 RepID=UPI003F5C23F1